MLKKRKGEIAKSRRLSVAPTLSFNVKSKKKKIS